jgi:simple sugar transport system permease protein
MVAVGSMTGFGRRALTRRSGVSGLLESLLAVVAVLVLGAVLLAITGHDPVLAYRELVSRTLLRPTGVQEVLVRATPLLLAGCAVLVAAKVGVWNIGIDGQVLVGALAGAVAADALTGAGRPVLWLGAALAGAIAGGLWGLVPALLRARIGINEIVTTIMFNYMAMSLTAWLVKGPLRDPSLVVPQTKVIDRSLRLPALGDTRVHLGLVVALLLTGILGWVLHRTVIGYELTVTGANPRAARYGLIPVATYVLAGFVVSGAVAGLAGVNDVLSTKGVFQAEWNPSYGLPAFALVFLARRQVGGLIPAALFLGLLSYGADVMPRAAGVAPAFFVVLEGALLVALALGAWARSRRGPWREGEP